MCEKVGKMGSGGGAKDNFENLIDNRACSLIREQINIQRTKKTIRKEVGGTFFAPRTVPLFQIKTFCSYQNQFSTKQE